MSDILSRPTVLVLNRHWQAIDVKSPADAFGMLAAGSASALDITDDGMRPVKWAEWLTLPVRDHDLPVRTARGAVRAAPAPAARLAGGPARPDPRGRAGAAARPARDPRRASQAPARHR
jgi:hypothetical protein